MGYLFDLVFVVGMKFNEGKNCRIDIIVLVWVN